MIVISKNIKNIKNIIKDSNSVVTVGFFDGFHKYHNDILKTTQKFARKNKLKFIVISFSQKISSYLEGTNSALITGEAKQTYISQNFDVDYYIELEADENLVNMLPIEFIKWMQKNLNTTAMVEGGDFTFGAQGIGTVKDLKDNFSPTNIIVKKRVKGFSTTKIKYYVEKGKIDKANKMLGMPFTINVVPSKGSHHVFDVKFPLIKIRQGYYEAIINDRIPAVVIINGENNVAISKLNGILDSDVLAIAPTKYLGQNIG